jgi:hypothetical protein
MKKLILFACVIFIVVAAFVLFKNILSGYASGLRIGVSSEQLCYDMSYDQVSDSMIASWDSLFAAQGIEDNPFAMVLYFIDHFSGYDMGSSNNCHSLQYILSHQKTNLRSSILITSAVMQKLGWDIQSFFTKDECYLGIHFDSLWAVRQGHWIESDSKQYYLKEFDTFTPTGFLNKADLAETYQSLIIKQKQTKPIPLVNSLPRFEGTFYEIPLRWAYGDREFSIATRIPADQVAWSRNLPPSLYGMVAAGIQEFENTDLIRQLTLAVSEFDEFDQVNVLLRLCQSESVFVYDNTRPIQSVSNQLYEGFNDCDGRSVFLYCLLRTVLDYTDADIMFITWPNHVALGVKPMTSNADSLLSTFGHYVEDGYYILDPTFIGETYWGTKMGTMPKECTGY